MKKPFQEVPKPERAIDKMKRTGKTHLDPGDPGYEEQVKKMLAPKTPPASQVPSQVSSTSKVCQSTGSFLCSMFSPSSLNHPNWMISPCHPWRMSPFRTNKFWTRKKQRRPRSNPRSKQLLVDHERVLLTTRQQKEWLLLPKRNPIMQRLLRS